MTNKENFNFEEYINILTIIRDVISRNGNY